MDAKEMILNRFEGSNVFITDSALKIAFAYAGTANADPEKIPQLFKNMVHVFTTGEVPEKEE